jgi:hypothetical protein
MMRDEYSNIFQLSRVRGGNEFSRMRTAGGSFTVCFVPETNTKKKCREKDEIKKERF